jgi:phospholipase C
LFGPNIPITNFNIHLEITMKNSTGRYKTLSLATTVIFTAGSIAPAFAGATTTPIEHVIVIVGENHTFDNLFGTYKPKAGQTIDNLLSKGIVNEDGTPGPHFKKAEQRIPSRHRPAAECA